MTHIRSSTAHHILWKHHLRLPQNHPWMDGTDIKNPVSNQVKGQKSLYKRILGVCYAHQNEKGTQIIDQYLLHVLLDRT